MSARTYCPINKAVSDWKCLNEFCRVFHAHGVTKPTAVHFAHMANIRIQALRHVARWESAQIGERRTAEAAKKRLAAFAKHLGELALRDDGPADDMARSLFQRAWVELGFPLTPDNTPYHMLDMLEKAASKAAGYKVKRGKRAVSEVEKLMWKNVAKEFQEIVGKKPVVSSGGLFNEAVGMIAKELVIDRPSRTVLSKCIVNI